MALTKISGSILKDPLNLGEVSIGGTLTYEDVTNVDSLGIGTFRAGINVSGGQLDVGSNIKLGNAGVITATSFVGSGANLTGIDATKIITGNTQVQTIDTGSDGHIKFTTEGSERARILADGKIGIGVENPSHLLHLKSASSPSIKLEDTTQTNILLMFAQDSDSHVGTYSYHPLVFDTNSTERLRIDAGGGMQLGTSTATASKLTVYGASDAAAIFQGSSTGTGAGNGLLVGNNGGTTGLLWNYENGNTLFATNNIERLRIHSTGQISANVNNNSYELTIGGLSGGPTLWLRDSGTTGSPRILFGDTSAALIGGITYNNSSDHMEFATNGTASLRIASDGSCYFGPQIITESDMNWGHDAHQRPFVFSGNQAGVNPADATIVVANPNTNPASTRLGSFMFGCKTSSGGNSGIKAYIEGWTTSNPSNAYEAGGYIKFVTRQSAGSLTEHFKIDHDGKLYKSGNHFYPLVNYSEYPNFSGASTSSSSYVDLRTILSGYTPKKAGNIIVIHHQSQCWQGNDANSNGDAMWKIQKQEGGGSWTDVIANERIMGNMDGRNYTGGSGLSRHHRTVHLMGSFECAGTSINLKTQGKVDFTGVGLQWYHHSQNILQVWEYEKG